LTDPTGLSAFGGKTSAFAQVFFGGAAQMPSLSRQPQGPSDWEIMKSQESAHIRISTQAMFQRDQAMLTARANGAFDAIVDAQRGLAENWWASLSVLDKAEMMGSAAQRQAFIAEKYGVEYAQAFEQRHAATLANDAEIGNAAMGYNSHPEQYTPKAWEAPAYRLAFGVLGDPIHSVVSSHSFMNMMDKARPVMTAVADIATFIPVVDTVAAPIAMFLHAANSYASGTSMGDIAIDFGTDAATQLVTHGATKAGTGTLRAAVFGVGLRPGPKISNIFGHNRMIRKVAREVTAQGDEVISGGRMFDGIFRKEAYFRTPGGKKSARRPDLLVKRADGTIYGVNVGKVAADDLPIKRELQALHDLAIRANLEMRFVAYGTRR
jgi:hypothetical protein